MLPQRFSTTGHIHQNKPTPMSGRLRNSPVHNKNFTSQQLHNIETENLPATMNGVDFDNSFENCWEQYAHQICPNYNDSNFAYYNQNFTNYNQSTPVILLNQEQHFQTVLTQDKLT